MKTVRRFSVGIAREELKHTEAWGEDGDVEFGGKFLHLYREHALAGYDIAGQADTHHLQDGFEDKHSQTR